MCLSLGMNLFCAGDEHLSLETQTTAFSPGHKRFWHWRPMRWKHAFELQLHTQVATSDFQNRTYVEMIASHSFSPLRMGAIMLWRSKRYLDAQRRLPLQLIGLQDHVNREKFSRTSAYSQFVASRLAVVHNARVQKSRCGPTICTTQNTWREAPEMSEQECNESLETILRL